MNRINRNLRYEDLRQWIGVRRKYLISRRDNADTQEGRFIFIGELRGLNELESQLNQLTTFVDYPIKPLNFPQDADQIGAILLEQFELPKTLHLNDLLNQNYLYKVINNWKEKQAEILILNRLVRNRGLVNQILKTLNRKMEDSSCGPEKISESPKEEIKDEIPTEEDTQKGTRGRMEGTKFQAKFKCDCGREFKYKKAFEKHKANCQVSG